MNDESKYYDAFNFFIQEALQREAQMEWFFKYYFIFNYGLQLVKKQGETITEVELTGGLEFTQFPPMGKN